MIRRVTLLLAMLGAPLALVRPARAQPAPDAAPVATALGVVHDRTGGPIAGATIRTDPGGVEARSDAAGQFAIAVEPGDLLIIDADGFETALVAIEGDGPVDVELVPLAKLGEVIELTDRKPTSVAGAVSLSRDELATLPGTGGDLLASLDALPGVTKPSGFGGGGNQGVIIRGSAPEDSRILLDGFDIPQLYHFLNRSIIPTRAVAGLEYLPGGFDVKYGRASSGVVAVTSRGGGDELEGASEVSVIDASVLGASPIGDDGKLLVSFRRSYLDAYLPALLPADVGLVTAPRYYDGLVRADWDVTDRLRGALTVVGSDDLTELVATDDQTAEEFRFRADTKFIRAIAAGYWRGDDGLTLDVGASALAQGVSFQFSDQYLNVEQVSLASRAELSKRYRTLAGLTDVIVRGGAELDPRRAVIDLRLNQGRDEGEADTGMDGPVQTFDDTVWLTDVGAWTALEASLSPQLRFSAGVRLDAFVRNRAYPVQPRGELTYRPDARTKLRLAAGRYTRPAEFQEELLFPDLGPESATQLTLGGERAIGDHANLQVTLYDTERTDLITRDEQRQLRNQGRGRSYGVDVLGSYRTDQWFGWLSYSLARSTRRDTATGPERLFDYDQTHDLVAAVSYKTRSKRWQFGGKWTYSSGQPTTPVLGSFYDSDLDLFLPQNGAVNSERLPSHHQLDLRVDHFWRFDAWTLSAFLDVSNVYLNAKVEQYQYNFDYSQRAEIAGLPIVPSIGLRGEL
ncbi:MAG: TonB-dependent receptor plug domain-containing protein [Myxococcales bacterium]|nr:TonB-dependent receptor plug domain-containing protein [Myxococcales bacterium]